MGWARTAAPRNASLSQSLTHNIITFQFIDQVNAPSLALRLRLHDEYLVFGAWAFEVLPEEVVVLRQHPGGRVEVVIQGEMAAHGV